MRGRWIVAIAIGAAACGDGVFIEVHRPAGMDVDRVELVIADRACQLDDGSPCDGLQGEDLPHLGGVGDVFFRDSRVPFAVELGDGDTAVFEIAPEDRPALPFVVALGTRATGQRPELVGLAVMEGTIDPARGTVRYQVELEPVARLDDPSRDGARALAWPVAAPDVQCLAFTDRRGKPKFIVPDDDLDCDAVAAPECAPLAFRAVETSGEHCVQPSAAIDGAPCVLGHVVTCDEQQAPARACLETATCVPGATCDPQRSGCELDDEQCQGDFYAQTPSPRLRCSLRGQLADNGTLVPCEPSLPTDPLDGLATKCDPPRFVDLATAGTPYDGGADKLAFDDVRIEAQQLGTCAIAFDWTGVAPAEGFERHALLEFGLVGEQSGESRMVLVPVTFDVAPSCAEAGRCTFEAETANDSIFTCTN